MKNPTTTFRALCERETSLHSNPNLVRTTLSSSLTTLHRLKLDRLLDGHAGCVNTVHFNPSGDLLLSGSDDLKVIIWDWSTGEHVHQPRCDALGCPPQADFERES